MVLLPLTQKLLPLVQKLLPLIQELIRRAIQGQGNTESQGAIHVQGQERMESQGGEVNFVK